MILKEDKFVLYKGPKGPSSIPGVFEVIEILNYRRGNKWGDAIIMGVSAHSTNTGILTFTSLAGISIVACGGTGTPVIVGNTISFPLGDYWDLRLSDGTYIPDPNSGYNVSDTGADGTPSNLTKTINVGGTMYFMEKGYNRDLSDNMIPAKESDITIDVLGDPILHPGVFNRLNFADGIIEYVSTNSLFNKNAYSGNAFSLPEVWVSNAWDYDDGNPLHWKQEERTMDYITSRINPAYKNTIMIKEIQELSVVVAISREEVYSTPISDKNYNILNLIYNNVPIPA